MALFLEIALFAAEKITDHKDEIVEMLNDLPDSFKTTGGGGMTFLNACETKDGDLWGQHSDIDMLLCLGMAIGKISFPMPREMWGVLPGGMPYVTYNDKTYTQ